MRPVGWAGQSSVVDVGQVIPDVVPATTFDHDRSGGYAVDADPGTCQRLGQTL